MYQFKLPFQHLPWEITELRMQGSRADLQALVLKQVLSLRYVIWFLYDATWCTVIMNCELGKTEGNVREWFQCTLWEFIGRDALKISGQEKLNGVQYKILTQLLRKTRTNSPTPRCKISHKTTPVLCATARHLTETCAVWSFGKFREGETPRESDKLLAVIAE